MMGELGGPAPWWVQESGCVSISMGGDRNLERYRGMGGYNSLGEGVCMAGTKGRRGRV